MTDRTIPAADDVEYIARRMREIKESDTGVEQEKCFNCSNCGWVFVRYGGWRDCPVCHNRNNKPSPAKG